MIEGGSLPLAAWGFLSEKEALHIADLLLEEAGYNRYGHKKQFRP